MPNNNSICLVTAPDDVLYKAKRLLLVDLTIDQQNFVSDVLRETASNFVVYVWNVGDDIEWLLDKQLKSDVVLVNLQSTEQLVVGYFLGYKKTFYFGDSKKVQKFSANAIYSTEQLLNIIEDQL